MLSFMKRKFINKHRCYEYLSQDAFCHGYTIKESVPTIFNKRYVSACKGSISVEASLVTPLFVFFIVTLMSFLVMIKDQSVYFQKMNDEALYRWECSAITKDDAMIEIKETYRLSPVISFFPGLSVSVHDEILLHPFTGYTGDSGKSNEESREEYVYVTETGTRYHVDGNCTHINIRPITIEASSLESIRNSDGCKYTKCKLCHPGKTGVLFITRDGDCYHCDANCSGLKRTVRMISLKEALVNGYLPCSKCS